MKKKVNPKSYETTEKLPVVAEAAVSYDHLGSILQVASLRPENQLSVTDKIQIVKDGIEKSDLVALKTRARLDYNELADALSVTRATLINKKDNEKFNMAVSEKILDLADLYAFGFEVFGDEDSFISWMNSPNRALQFQSPFSFVDNQFGRQEVRNLIGRIAYGVYS